MRRSQILATGEFYHVFNRSVGHEEIFTSQRNLNRIYNITDYYRYPQILRFSQFQLLSHENQINYLKKMKSKSPIVELLAFSFMPNHYHFLLQQLHDHGISYFIANLQNSFAKYFNLKHNRHGSLFQSPFKAKRVSSNEEMLHVSRYIHLNPVTSFMINFEDLAACYWTSFMAYMNNDAETFINKEKILGLSYSKDKYHRFVADQEDFQKKLSEIKHLIPDV